jgi:hypothetical protein
MSRKYEEPTVTHREIVWVDTTHRMPAEKLARPGEKVYRVWTWLGISALADEPEKPELPARLVHGHNAFLEDYVHDWTLDARGFRYFSRIREKNEPTWIVVEYVAEESQP